MKPEVDAILQIILGVIECIQRKREAGLKRRIGYDVARFAEALANGDTDTISAMLADLPDVKETEHGKKTR
jgi:hypothetical protein